MTKKANLILYQDTSYSERICYYAYARDPKVLKVSAYGQTQRFCLGDNKKNYYDDHHPKCNGEAYSHEGKMLLAERLVNYGENVSLMPMELFT